MNKLDKLGCLKSKIADLVRQESDLKDAIIEEMGYGKFDGKYYTVTVSETERSILDQEAVRRFLSPQFIRAHTRTITYDVVKVTARQREVA